jgi:hypothetical protein
MKRNSQNHLNLRSFSTTNQQLHQLQQHQESAKAPKNCIPTMEGSNCSQASTQSQDGMLHQARTHPMWSLSSGPSHQLKAGLQRMGDRCQAGSHLHSTSEELVMLCTGTKFHQSTKHRFWNCTTSRRRKTQLQFEPSMLRSPFKRSLGIH